MTVVAGLILFCDAPYIVGKSLCPGGQKVIMWHGIWHKGFYHRPCRRDVAESDKLPFRLDIFAYLKFNLGATPFSHMATIAVYIGLGVTHVA